MAYIRARLTPATQHVCNMLTIKPIITTDKRSFPSCVSSSIPSTRSNISKGLAAFRGPGQSTPRTATRLQTGSAPLPQEMPHRPSLDADQRLPPVHHHVLDGLLVGGDPEQREKRVGHSPFRFARMLDLVQFAPQQDARTPGYRVRRRWLDSGAERKRPRLGHINREVARRAANRSRILEPISDPATSCWREGPSRVKRFA